MAFRAVRTAAVIAFLLLLTACGNDDGPVMDRTVSPADLSDTLSAHQLAELPRYGVQHLDCEDVGTHVDSTANTTETDSIEISLQGDTLMVEPRKPVASLGDTITWHADSLVWVVRYQELTPFADSAFRVRGSYATKAAQSARRTVRTAITADENRCGRYYFLVAAYELGQPDVVYVADPPMWIPE